MTSIKRINHEVVVDVEIIVAVADEEKEEVKEEDVVVEDEVVEEKDEAVEEKDELVEEKDEVVEEKEEVVEEEVVRGTRLHKRLNYLQVLLNK
jgi:hypothetical protein